MANWYNKSIKKSWNTWYDLTDNPDNPGYNTRAKNNPYGFIDRKQRGLESGKGYSFTHPGEGSGLGTNRRDELAFPEYKADSQDDKQEAKTPMPSNRNMLMDRPLPFGEGPNESVFADPEDQPVTTEKLDKARQRKMIGPIGPHNMSKLPTIPRPKRRQPAEPFNFVAKNQSF